MSLKVHNLKKSYSSKVVVNDVSFDVNPGEVVGLLGPNGAGKTTSFDMVVGLVKPDHGAITLGEKDITKFPIHERSKAGLGYLTQEPSIFRRLTVEDNLRFVLEILENVDSGTMEDKLATLLEEFNLTDLRNHVAVSLSGGERRRVEIARVIATDPAFILLDEPFTGIDPIAIQDIQALISDLKDKRQLGVLLTDHNPKATLAITDRAYIIQDGKILLDGKAEAIAKDSMARKYYLGEDFKL